MHTVQKAATVQDVNNLQGILLTCFTALCTTGYLPVFIGRDIATSLEASR